jgi:hypothetical protein
MTGAKMGRWKAAQIVAAVERARQDAERDVDEAAVVARVFKTNKARAAALLRMARAVRTGEG